MTLPKIQGRTLALLAILIPLVAAFLWLALTSGPLAPVPVTLTTVTEHALAPALFGVGTVEARYTYRIGPTFAGRVSRVEVQVGDRVQAGQLLGEMDPRRIRSSPHGLEGAAGGSVSCRSCAGSRRPGGRYAPGAGWWRRRYRGTLT